MSKQPQIPGREMYAIQCVALSDGPAAFYISNRLTWPAPDPFADASAGTAPSDNTVRIIGASPESSDWTSGIISHQVIVNLIVATTTTNSLFIRADLDKGNHPKEVKFSEQEMAQIDLVADTFHGG